MALFGTSGGLIGAALSLFGGGSSGAAAGFARAAGTTITALAAPQPAAIQALMPSQPLRIPPQGPTSLAMGPQLGLPGISPSTMGGRMAMKFPALGNWIAMMRAQGIPMTLRKAFGLLKRFGVELLVGLGIMSAVVGTELMIASTVIKPRRMNVGNTKALRRSIRRVEGFHRLCQRADIIAGRSSRRRKSKGSPGDGIKFIQQK